MQYQQPYKLVMQTLDPNPSYWCKFEAVDQTSFIIIVSIIVGQSFLFCLFLRSLAIRYTYKIYISKDEGYLFRVMSIWFSIAFLKSILNIIVYTVYEKNNDDSNLQSQIVLSGICMFLDKMGSFSLHTVLMKIPCIWIKNSIMKLENEELSFSEMKRVDFVFRVLSKMNIYFKVRIIVLVLNLTFLVLFYINPNLGRFALYLTLISMVEAGIAIFIYTFGFVNLQKFRNLLDFPKRIQMRVKIQYSLLMTGCVMRLIFNFLYYFKFSLNIYEPAGNCSDLNKEQSSLNYFYLSLGYTVMHILPITTIILIYWPQIDKNQQKQSLVSLINGEDEKKRIRIQTSSCLLGSGFNMKNFDNSQSSSIQYSGRKQQRNKSYKPV